MLFYQLLAEPRCRVHGKEVRQRDSSSYRLRVLQLASGLGEAGHNFLPQHPSGGEEGRKGGGAQIYEASCSYVDDKEL